MDECAKQSPEAGSSTTSLLQRVRIQEISCACLCQARSCPEAGRLTPCMQQHCRTLLCAKHHPSQAQHPGVDPAAKIHPCAHQNRWQGCCSWANTHLTKTCMLCRKRSAPGQLHCTPRTPLPDPPQGTPPRSRRLPRPPPDPRPALPTACSTGLRSPDASLSGPVCRICHSRPYRCRHHRRTSPTRGC